MIVERWHAVLDAQPVAIAETATALVLGLDDGRVLHLDWRNGRALARVALHEAGLVTVHDLLRHYPRRHEDRKKFPSFSFMGCFRVRRLGFLRSMN